MSLKDQASKLREMMNVHVKQQDNCVPVAVFSCGIDNGEGISKSLAWQMAKKQGKKTVHINTDTNANQVQQMAEEQVSWSHVEPILESVYVELEESFLDMHEKLRTKQNKASYVHVLSQVERNKEVLWYYCGSSINAKAMNLMAFSSIVLLVVKDEKRSVEAARNAIRVQRKMHQRAHFYVVGLDMDNETLAQIVGYLQQADSLLLEHHVQEMGTISTAHIQVGVSEEKTNWKEIIIPIDGKNKPLSERIQLAE